MVWLRYAKDRLGNIIDIQSVTDSYIAEYGNDSFTCLGCGKAILSKRGKIKRHHFAHVAEQEGTCSFETYLHKMGISKFIDVYKKRIKENKEFLLEVAKGEICYKSECPYGRKNTCDNITGYTKISLLPKYSSCEREVRDGGFIPDILLSTEDGQKIYIEITVTHPVQESKIESGIPIVEIKLKSEADVTMFEEGFLSQRNKHVKMYNFHQCTKPINDSCESQLQIEKNDFIRTFRDHRQNNSPFKLNFNILSVCGQDCPYMEGHPCTENKNAEYDIAKKCTEIETASSGRFSPDFYIQPPKGAKIRFNFAFELFPKLDSFNGERTIQFAKDKYKQKPWRQGEITDNNDDTRFFNFKPIIKDLCADAPKRFQIITLHKNGTLNRSHIKPIDEIYKEMIEEIDQIADYILLPESESNPTQCYSDYILTKLLERSCKSCTYFDKLRPQCKPYSTNNALLCEHFKRNFQADKKLVDLLQSKDKGYENLLNYRERFRLKFPETNK